MAKQHAAVDFKKLLENQDADFILASVLFQHWRESFSELVVPHFLTNGTITEPYKK